MAVLKKPKGDTLNLSVAVKNSDDTAYNLTGLTLSVIINGECDEDVVANAISNRVDTAGTLDITVPSAHSMSEYRYSEIRLVGDNSGDISTLMLFEIERY